MGAWRWEAVPHHCVPETEPAAATTPHDPLLPELVKAVRAHLPTRCVIDAEIVVPDPEGPRLDFDAVSTGYLPWLGFHGRRADSSWGVHPSSLSADILLVGHRALARR